MVVLGWSVSAAMGEEKKEKPYLSGQLSEVSDQTRTRRLDGRVVLCNARKVLAGILHGWGSG